MMLPMMVSQCFIYDPPNFQVWNLFDLFSVPKNDVIHLLQPRRSSRLVRHVHFGGAPGHGPSYSGPLTAMPKSGHGTPTGRRLRNRSESDLRGNWAGPLMALEFRIGRIGQTDIILVTICTMLLISVDFC